MSEYGQLLSIEPLDTLFFRDGRPYIKDESEQVGVASQFPPTPATLVGAVRAAAARALGWSGKGKEDWSDDTKQNLGDGEELAGLRFRGPLLLQDGESLFPAPASLMKNQAGKTVLLAPGTARDCDLGQSVRLPGLPSGSQGDGWKQVGNAWLSSKDFAATLEGKAPTAESIKQELWSLEARVGIARDESTRTTGEGALYSPQHVRLQHDVTLGMWADGLDKALLETVARNPQPVGGEARSAWIKVARNAPDMPAPPGILQRDGENLNYSIVVLSPLPLVSAPAPGQAIPELPGLLVSACMSRALMLGGWDSVKKRPLPLKPHLAPGSVLFMQTRAEDDAAVRALHGTCIGSRPAWGYGWIATGTWRNQ